MWCKCSGVTKDVVALQILSDHLKNLEVGLGGAVSGEFVSEVGNRARLRLDGDVGTLRPNLIRSSERSRGGEQDQEVEGAVSLTQGPI
jgi:hypothetical protein